MRITSFARGVTRAVVLAGASVVIAACGPDPAVTRDNVIADLSSYGVVDEACVGDVIAKYSDDELDALDREARALSDPSDTRPQVTISKPFRDFYATLLRCVTTTSSTGASTTDSTTSSSTISP